MDYNKIYTTYINRFSIAFAFKTGLFNIGAEGQFIIGALVATIVGCWITITCNNTYTT